MCLEQKHLLVLMLFMLHTAGQHIDVYVCDMQYTYGRVTIFMNSITG